LLLPIADELPSVNAVLNAASLLLALGGFVAIRRRRVALHRGLMLSAFGSSTLFLAGYLTRLALTGTHRYPGSGAAKAAYLSLLASHTLLAAVLVPLVLRTIYLSLLRKRFAAHRRIARLTLPIWIYVSATGVMVYLLLYQLAS
jgi:putative membrane protein